MSLGRLYLLVMLATAGMAGMAATIATPPTWVHEEDGPLEMATALAFGTAFVVAQFRMRSALADPTVETDFRWYVGFVLLIGLFAYLDEISYGESIFGFDTFEVLGKRIDGVHDFIVVLQRVVRLHLGLTRMQTVLTLFFATALACSVLLFFWGRELWALLRHSVQRDHWMTVIAVVLFLLPALVIDASGLTEQPGIGPAFALAEELLELNGGLALLHGIATTKPLRGRSITAFGT